MFRRTSLPARQFAVLLATVIPAFAIIGAAQATRLLPARSYGSLFILVFAWIGAHHRPGTSFRVLPFAVVGYVVPVVLVPHDVPFSVPGCIVTLSVCVVIAETIARAMTSRATAESEAARTAETMRLILDSAAQPTIALDGNGLITIANRAAAATLGVGDGQELVGLELHDQMHHTRRDGTPYPVDDCPIYQALHDGTSARLDGELYFQADGSAFFADCRIEPLRSDEVAFGAVVTFTDVTQRRRVERETQARLHHSERAALTDALTGVGNRRYADSFLAQIAPGDAVVLIDIDHFKQINDTAGHAAGDKVLRALAQHLAAQIRGDDHVARFGGEEFLLLLARGSSTAVGAVQRIAAAWAAGSDGVTFSAGVAAHASGQPVLETLAAADRALYTAKSQGRDRIVAAGDSGAVRA